MRVDETLFKLPYLAYFVRTHDDEDLSEYELEPLMGPTLPAANAPNQILQGYFIVAAKLVAHPRYAQDSALRAACLSPHAF